MDAIRFDRLVQSMTISGTRRGVLRHLGMLPLGGALATFLATDSEAAKHHHRAQQRHHADHRDQLQEQRKKKKKKCAPAGQSTSKKRKACCAGLVRDGSGVCLSATPDAPPALGCTPATCAPNACGSVPDGCGGTLSCGDCAGNSLCVNGTCQPCDVCPSGCFFSSVQQAVNAASSGETIRICAGVYTGDMTINQSLSLIGAGDGNGAGSTILRGSGTTSVVLIGQGTTVRLQDLRITGGGGPFGAGLLNRGALTLTDCTVTGNTAISGSGGSFGGGIFNGGGFPLTLNGCTITGNTASGGGGIENSGTLTLTDTTVSGNRATAVGGGISNGGNSVATLTLDAASRVTGNTASLTIPDSGGGIHKNGGTVTLSSADNVTGNTPDNCGGEAVPLCSG